MNLQQDIACLNMSYKSILLTVGILSFFFSSCWNLDSRNKKQKDEKWKKYSQQVIEDHIGAYISLPNCISFPDFSKKSIDSILSKDVKVLFNVDIDCGSCLIKFSFWKQFTEKLYANYKIQLPVLAFINSSRPETVVNRVNKYWEYGWVYDSQYEFLDMNKLHDDRFQAVLVDRNNKIIMIGNPMHNNVLEDLYERTIIQLVKEAD